jgi:disulfide oxidoreductase YuzD
MEGGCSCCSGGCSSEADCGTTMDFANLTAQMSDELKKVYGDKVEVKYVDVDQTGLDNYPLMNQVLQMGYPYPITLIDGQPKFAGGIMTAEVKQVIEETLKVSAN